MALPVTAAELRNKPKPQGGIDPAVKIPRSVVEAGKRSEELQRVLTGQAEPSVANPPPAEGEPAPQVTPTGNEGTTPAPAPAETPPQPEAPATPPAVAQPVEDEASWERRFKSLQGRMETDARRSREMVTTLSQRLEQLEQENRTLRSVQPVELEQPNGHSSLTEQEIADYGPEFVDVMRRVVADATGPLNAEIQNLRGQLGHVQAETGNAFLSRMNSTLNASVPNWAELNKNPRFIEWSQLPDIFSGAIRKVLMQEAWNSGDPHRVAAFFHAYLAEEAATNPQRVAEQRQMPPSRMVVSDTPVVPPINPPTPGTPFDLSVLAAPGRAHSAGGAPAEKPVYTSADITKFYTDVAAGRWRGREREQYAIDQDIMLAQREGRILVDQRNLLPKDPYAR